MNSLLVRDYMRGDAQVVLESATITEVVDKLLSYGLTGAPVVDDKRRVVGFISEQDCIRQLLQSSYHSDVTDSVTDVMNKKPLTVKPDDSIADVAQLMVSAKPKSLSCG